MSTEAMKVERNRQFANPAQARKLARDVKKQAELRQRLTKAIVEQTFAGETLAEVDRLVDVIIEELKK